jgi:hypothetical protein
MFRITGPAKLDARWDATVTKNLIVLVAQVFLPLIFQITPVVAETIQLVHHDDNYLVPVQVNNALILPFILDTGADDVVIPADVFLTLSRPGTVNTGDFIGTGTAVLADGSEHPTDHYVLHELRVGDHVVRNVVASVSPVKGEPLLGQSFLSKLPAWTIDNVRHALVLNDMPGSGAPQRAALPPPQAMPSVPAPTAPAVSDSSFPKADPACRGLTDPALAAECADLIADLRVHEAARHLGRGAPYPTNASLEAACAAEQTAHHEGKPSIAAATRSSRNSSDDSCSSLGSSLAPRPASRSGRPASVG